VPEFEKTQVDPDRQAGPESVYLSQRELRIVPLASSIQSFSVNCNLHWLHNVMDSRKVFETF
jgi:hypothetical protein